MSTTAKKHHIEAMMTLLGTFHGRRFSFDCNAGWFKRHSPADRGLADEWKEMWYGAKTGQCDGHELEILWAPWYDYDMSDLYES